MKHQKQIMERTTRSEATAATAAVFAAAAGPGLVFCVWNFTVS
jgi:hypothetical protein